MQSRLRECKILPFHSSQDDYISKQKVDEEILKAKIVRHVAQS